MVEIDVMRKGERWKEGVNERTNEHIVAFSVWRFDDLFFFFDV